MNYGPTSRQRFVKQLARMLMQQIRHPSDADMLKVQCDAFLRAVELIQDPPPDEQWMASLKDLQSAVNRIQSQHDIN